MGVNIKKNRFSLKNNRNKTFLTPSLPLRAGKKVGYELLEDHRDVVFQNLKNLFLTSKGEKTWDMNFGVGLRRFLFEPMTLQTKNNIESEIYSQVSKYMPYIVIQELDIIEAKDDNTFYINMTFSVPALEEELNILLDVSNITTTSTPPKFF